MANHATPLKYDQVVWLQPHTPQAPAVCHRPVPFRVKDHRRPWVTIVDAAGEQFQVHEDNVCRSDPSRRRRAAELNPKPQTRKPLAGAEEIPLF